jgi:chemotaxis protein methyltransferase CheR
MNTEIEEIEVNLLLEAIFQRYGHDFRNYARASIDRRVRQFLVNEGLASVSELIPRLLRDESFFQGLLASFSITVTEMFRDPEVYHSLREKVVPYLKTYPYIKVWHAGCSTGEEAYSLAILLKEEGIYDKAILFATDFNDRALENAKEGIYPIDKMQKSISNYNESGGIRPFSDYYHAGYGSIVMDGTLKERITFANHNLVCDGVFGEMNLILCRNVLIYFDQALQQRVLNLFNDSLPHGGFLCLGNKETLQFSDLCEQYKVIDKKAKIYQKQGR